MPVRTKNISKNLHISKKYITFAPLLKPEAVISTFGEMVEWSITTVLKTVVLRGTGGSNPSLSALISNLRVAYFSFGI